MITLAVMMMTAVGFAQISGTAHDFSGKAWNSDNNGAGSAQICNACHTPHGATTADAPLWDRATTGGAFAAYVSPTFDADDLTTASDGIAAAYSATPTGVSALCLSCHDGTSKLVKSGLLDTTITAAFTRNGGADEHPISIDYSTQLVAADGGLKTVAPVTTAGLLFGGSVECSSCHDVHNANNIDAGKNLLSVSNNGSALCLTCHAK